ncbi:hypothetical protein CI610_02813 [invertebrate metagenome]|uniref:Uncharacterized protein n=1 Tax=invertebrate metagenome TaxID=1711999 RepID=A0A2H9T4W3_9ZZZZ
MNVFKRITKEGGFPVGLTSDTEAYDAWFQKQVKEALNSEDALSYSQVMDGAKDLIERKKRRA